MLPGKNYSAREIVRVLLRHRWLVLLPVALGLVAATSTALGVPECPPSEAIMTIAGQVPQTTGDGDSAPTSSEALASITQRILSQSRLEDIARDFDLYPEVRAGGNARDGARRLRREIEVRSEGQNTFRIAYVNCDPAIAQAVTGRLASLFLAENTVAQYPAENLNRILADRPAPLGEQKAKLYPRPADLQFGVVNSASLPQRTDNLVYLRRLVAGAVSGLMLGLALVALMEYRNSSFSSAGDVSRVLGLPVLGIVPVMRSTGERRMLRFRQVAIDVIACLVLLWAVVLVLRKLWP